MKSTLLPCQRRAALLSSCEARPLNFHAAAHASCAPPRPALACRAAAVASVSYDVADAAVLRSLERPTNNIVSLGSRLPRYIAVKEPTSWVPSSLPGPSAEESSGLDFVDLVNTPRPEVQARLQDAATYLMLGCANGVLQPLSEAAAAASPVNVRALTRFRNNVTRNLSPAVAVACSDAMQAAKAATKRRVQELLEQQRAAMGAINGGGAGAASSSFAGSGAGNMAQVPCRFVVAPASAEHPLETPVPALCVNDVDSAGDGAAAPVIVVAADVSAASAAAARAAAVVAAPAEAVDSAAERVLAPAPSHGAPSSSGGDLDALQHQSEHHAVGGGGSGRRRGSRGRGLLSGAGRLQDQSDAAWI
ncbi:hypothetical protein HXX76_012321 [Chlamydomonas incerta]|uniref:Uncharacterized protein n=1 Tax=Chlamydomonas incerta TaxID=51695 RepID=A0A835SIA0_CHLIN|nr:hypothetical protein HXX76_012321 [Chlamydomonas incerta]|eukprot:KAG2427672.1 hypothetical protein HXX76_012321 [Chlamydomonas incerta]